MNDETSWIDLDANATTRPAPEVVVAVTEAMAAAWGNPSSRHASGQSGRRALVAAREQVASLLGASPDEVVFTSGATEANRLAIGLALEHGRRNGRTRIVAGAAEHSSILETLKGLELAGRCAVSWLPVQASGVLSVDAAQKALGDDVCLLSVQWANNETGHVQPIAGLANLARSRGALFHTDAAQAIGRVPVPIASVQPDLVSISGHKLHGPLGVGALLCRPDLRVPADLASGYQERGRRGGTENLPGVVGFATALALTSEALEAGAMERVRRLRDRLEAGLLRMGALRNGDPEPRLPNTLSVRFPGLDGGLLVQALSRQGVLTSTGSACRSDALEPSHVLLAMGIGPDEAKGSLRLSLGRDLQDAQAREAERRLREVIGRVQRLS
jgi:cysteine desulfurase